MKFLQKIKKHRVTIVLGLGVILVISVFLSTRNESDPTSTSDTTPVPANPTTVTVVQANELSNQANSTALGQVEAKNKAFVTTETGGQVARVNVTEGQQVTSGQVIAVLRNDAQRSAVRQAEANLASAKAAAAQSDIGTSNAEVALAQAIDTANNALQNAYSSSQRIVIRDIDQFFSNPRSGFIGAKIGSGSLASQLNRLRTELRTILPNWSRIATTEAPSAPDATQAIDVSVEYTKTTEQLINTLITALENEDAGARYTQAQLRSLQTTLTQRRDTLASIRTKLQNARSQIKTNENKLAQATLGGSTAELSSAQAQIQQAEASLEDARTALENTFLRAPISGQVDNFDLSLGEYLTPGTAVATITQKDGVQINAYVRTEIANALDVGTEVRIDNDRAGTITAIAPSTNSQNGKVEVSITTKSSTDFTIGDTVKVTLPRIETNSTQTKIRIPITAVRFSGESTSVLQVDDAQQLFATEVTLGQTEGDTVVVSSGISSSTPIVLDVRGKQIGQTVEIESPAAQNR
jgi:RND family efflux transporter MFP subunit